MPWCANRSRPSRAPSIRRKSFLLCSRPKSALAGVPTRSRRPRGGSRRSSVPGSAGFSRRRTRTAFRARSPGRARTKLGRRSGPRSSLSTRAAYATRTFSFPFSTSTRRFCRTTSDGLPTPSSPQSAHSVRAISPCRSLRTTSTRRPPWAASSRSPPRSGT